MRPLVFAALSLFSADLYAQVNKFQPEDLGKLIVIAASWQQIEGFDWTPEQYDTLARTTVDYRQLTGPASFRARRRRPTEEERRQLLDTIYKVANEEQIKRLHQTFFQRLMNYGQMEIPLQAFAPDAIQERDKKLQRLNAEIAEKLKEVTNNLPEVNPNMGLGRDGHYQVAHDKLVEFLDWRWKKQIGWLREELGEEMTDELIGEPILLSYSFLIEGDSNNPYGWDAFGGPPWGGSLYSSHSSGMSSTGGNGSRHVTLQVGNFDPKIGKVRDSRVDKGNRYGQVNGPKPPVRVPDGMTLEKAKAQLAKLREKVFTMAEETGASINVMRQNMRNAPPGPNRGLTFRMSMEQQKQLEADLERDQAKIQVDLTRWSRIIEELGGDPNEQQNKIRQARSLFFHYHLYRCNDNTFLSNIGATAKQCDALDKVAAGIGSPDPQNEDALSEYITRVEEVLDKRQQAMFNQQIFRSYWFSEQASRAFKRTKIKLTAEQLAVIEDVADRFAEAKQAYRNRQRLSLGMGGGFRGSRPETYYVEFAREFRGTLDDLVGREVAKRLLGQHFEYDQDWKRPVEIPAGVTLEQAEEEFKNLKAEKDDIDAKIRSQIVLGHAFGREPHSNIAEMKRKKKEYNALGKRLEKAQRIVEELKSRDGH